jgi:hypothetical protein
VRTYLFYSIFVGVNQKAVYARLQG